MNYKLIISYCGTNFYGFAKQGELRTIEKVIIDIFNELFSIDVKLFASGRTDRYVHAYGQVINVKHEKLNYDSETLKNALRSKLPSDIKIISCEIVNEKFHARFNAKNKTYIYKLNFSNENDIFNRDLIYQYNNPINFEKLDIFIEKIVGTHNFLSFSTTEIEDTIRTINWFNYEIQNQILIFKINGNGYLRNMVRMIVGCFLNFNEDKITLKDIDYYFNNPKKGAVIRKEKGCGLYLLEVNY